MGLKQTIDLTHNLFTQLNIKHALIGGMALSVLGVQRATADVDYLIEDENRELVKREMQKIGFRISFESVEVVHFSGLGQVDILFARRPVSKKMLQDSFFSKLVGIDCLLAEDLIGLKIQALVNDPKRELQDKADIQALIRKYPQLDWKKIKSYADLFGVWAKIKELKDE